MARRRENVEHIKTHASKKLRRNLRILSIVYFVLLIVTLYDVVVSGARFWQVMLAIIIGMIAGVISARMFRISWDEDQTKVAGRIDIYGIIILILFVVFELNRTWIAELFTTGEAIGSISLVLVTGALFGRILSTSKKILRVLTDEGIVAKN